MFHVENAKIKKLLLKGNVGLEKESLRVTEDGRMAHSPHPFDPYDPNITRDFCENQTEINTNVFRSASEAVASVRELTGRIERVLADLPRRECLWPFSNPPYIRDEDDVPVAVFDGARASKTTYRHYLSDVYGRYKMAFCGIHYNFSFDDELLEEDFKLGEIADFREYKNQVYLGLAEKAVEYGWIVTALTAASPVLDASFIERGVQGRDAFLGMASARCGELGYWNHFTPILSYESAKAYSSSIQRYVDEGLIAAPTELYYPIRLKPRGFNDLHNLGEIGIDHIELRMFDLNPLRREGIDEKDAIFTHLFLAFLASTPKKKLDPKSQINAAQNFKNAAKYDFDLVKVLLPNGSAYKIADAGLIIIRQMKKFYDDAPEEIQEVLRFEESKFLCPETRYPCEIRRRFGDGFWKKGLALAKEIQEGYRV